MFAYDKVGRMKEKDKLLCSMCKTGVGTISVLSITCQKWVHKWCSGMKGSLYKASPSFVCKVLKHQSQMRRINDGSLAIPHGILLEKVCYLSDIIDADGGRDLTVTARVK